MANKFKANCQSKIDLLKKSHVDVSISSEDDDVSEESEQKNTTKKRYTKPKRKTIKFSKAQADRLSTDKAYLDSLSVKIRMRTDIGEIPVPKLSCV